MCISQKLKSGTRLGLNPSTPIGNTGAPSWHLNCYSRHLALSLPCIEFFLGLAPFYLTNPWSSIVVHTKQRKMLNLWHPNEKSRRFFFFNVQPLTDIITHKNPNIREENVNAVKRGITKERRKGLERSLPLNCQLVLCKCFQTVAGESVCSNNPDKALLRSTSSFLMPTSKQEVCSDFNLWAPEALQDNFHRVQMTSCVCQAVMPISEKMQILIFWI